MGVKIAEAGKRNYTGPISSAPISLRLSILVMVISLLSGVCHVAIIAHYQTIFQGLSDFVSKTACHEVTHL
ncbi:hypothetical protein DKX38_002745 [Salix brachista]|uniref:Uncharacterized protein n=1 Tax=Salix brachista TaxID=2182728 RepID=A0A5N5NNR3_9ROSI|nr:hypothetical protein DKX38_002745 [Salix brachista]